MYNLEEIKKELSQAVTNGESLSDIRDQAHEWVEGFVPIYNNKIIAEWQSMPSEYDNRGSAELGHLGHEIDIINLMSLDLFIYYTELVEDAILSLEEDEEE